MSATQTSAIPSTPTAVQVLVGGARTRQGPTPGTRCSTRASLWWDSSSVCLETGRVPTCGTWTDGGSCPHRRCRPRPRRWESASGGAGGAGGAGGGAPDGGRGFRAVVEVPGTGHSIAWWWWCAMDVWSGNEEEEEEERSRRGCGETQRKTCLR